MKPGPHDPASSMGDLFRLEVENQSAVLNTALLEFEKGRRSPELLDTLMRAAHSLKGACRIMNLQASVRLTHALEDCFIAAQRLQTPLLPAQTDRLFRIVDLISQLSHRPEEQMSAWEAEHASEINELTSWCESHTSVTHPSAPPASRSTEVVPRRGPGPEPPERVLRVAAENLNRLLGLAGESLVESRWLGPFTDSLQVLKRQHLAISQKIELLRYGLPDLSWSEQARSRFEELSAALERSGRLLTERLEELEAFDRRSAHLSHRLYLEVLRTRMRPFADGVRRFPRMVRDLARSLGKDVRLEIDGESTQVDREILERLEGPLSHLLRNAVDHGCQTRSERERAGKNLENSIQLEARHSAGMLLVSVSDDGCGVDMARLREVAVQKGIATPSTVQRLTDSELLDFLLLPGFSLKDSVTEISGRGVGLDAVQNMVRSVRGALRLANLPGRGLKIQLQLPQTLSVLRALLVQIDGEPYAIPLNQIASTLVLEREQLARLEGREHFQFGDEQVGLVPAHQVLQCDPPAAPNDRPPVIVLADRNTRYGLSVDKFLGQRELVVQPLDPRLGKISYISAAALMEDGSPVLILDTEEILRSIEKLVWEGLDHPSENRSLHPPRRRVLVVDDSRTVREFQQKILGDHGYSVDAALDGMDAWDRLHSETYDLVITDLDMPRLDGIALTAMIKKDSTLKSKPVIIVSYKDEDKSRGLAAGADFYLTKGTFEQDQLISAVTRLIGQPQP